MVRIKSYEHEEVKNSEYGMFHENTLLIKMISHIVTKSKINVRKNPTFPFSLNLMESAPPFSSTLHYFNGHKKPIP